MAAPEAYTLDAKAVTRLVNGLGSIPSTPTIKEVICT